MPRYKKGCIGRRTKRSGTKSKSVDQQSTIRDSASPPALHDNTTCLPGILDDNIVRQLQWAEAWAAFYIGAAEHHQEAVASESHSHGASTDSDNCSADAFYVLVGKMHQYNPDDNLDDVVTGILHHRRYQQYLCLKNTLFEEYDQLGDFTIIWTKEDVIKLAQFYEGSDLAVKLAVTITPSLMASISVHRQKIGHDHDFWIGLPKFFSTLKDVKNLLSKLSSYHVCLGNYEDKYSHLVPIGVGLSQTAASGISAYRECDFGVNINGIEFSSTIRSARCALLALGKTRCEHCCRYRSTLRKVLSRNSVSPKPCQPHPHKLSHKTHKHMTKMELVNKFQTVKTHNQALKSELGQLKRKVFHNKGLKLNTTSVEDLRHMLKEYSSEVQRSYPDENSLQRLFGEQQVKYSNQPTNVP
ncbi:uncharacterized protein LOC124285222 [Haliotis rubra]|uniref:uncharacterized protein LOC124285222 n=1 Tax=Haliotis rubra TaxID=36100 RepID=UPI001EE5C9F3|nr:uncharacterized protein LOC124285222 [Haliotis rubra]